MNAPATAPTGPRTIAPDTAPKAALPARSCALASNEKNDPAITAATSSLFIAVPLNAPREHVAPKLRRHEGKATAAIALFKMSDQKARNQSAGAGFQNSCDDEDMPVICPTRQILLPR